MKKGGVGRLTEEMGNAAFENSPVLEMQAPAKEPWAFTRRVATKSIFPNTV